MLASLSREAKGLLTLIPIAFSLYWLWGQSIWTIRSPFKDFTSSTGIKWRPCFEDPTFHCGYLRVPTDYKDPTAGTSRLALTKYPATCSATDRLGIIITNYGGPGVSGREASFGTARRIQNMTGNRHDIISFDQRGLGHSTPRVDCFGSRLRYQMFKTNTVLETTFSVPKDPFSAEGRAILVEQQKEALVLEQAQATLCSQTMGAQALGYMSTTMTVYDMEEISRVLEGEKAPINFWGGSYGTIVGGYLANILPHKAGKIYIDGVVPADIWSNEHYETQALVRLFLTDSEKTYQLFLEECFNAGPKHCALTKAGDSSASVIGKRIDDFIDRLQTQPIQVPNHVRPGYLTSGGIRSSLFNALQMPEEWPIYSEMLASAINGTDSSKIMRVIAFPYSEPNPPADPEGLVDTGQAELMRLAIACGDALPYQAEQWPTAETIVDQILTTLRAFPRFGATVHLMEQHGGCQFWPGMNVGPTRFRGPWNKTLSTPMLLVANSHDPVTPYAAAKIVHETMGNSSRLILQETAGHSYIGTMTECAASIIRRYFVEGVIPTEPETRCPREITNFFTDERVFGVNPTILKSHLGDHV
ncbi:hypothetical protein MIND_00595000 [Mycena indigotica]|uniref:Uncharacterized protein n=1 Tax=Mycena indigotica TaxID=2126181 RepID=A0A8H6SS17_9AGAR|nr:uncharacterized protein MIND_00595000 [Mycena indigotica]KAF7303656.1 hypothetical protein MIND_00595000 [Mycena indigotica]